MLGSTASNVTPTVMATPPGHRGSMRAIRAASLITGISAICFSIQRAIGR
jgi:hypothetical protein